MISAKDHLRHLIDCLSDEEAETLLDAAERLGLLGNADLAPESCSCPSCGERRLDKLEWTEDDCLLCASCGTTYDPNGQGPLEQTQ
jgi:hypothetical protein